MKGFIKFIFIFVFIFALSSLAYGNDAFIIRDKSNMNFSITKSGDRYFINYEGVEIDPQPIDALLVIDGKIKPGYYPIIQGGHSLLPVRAVSEALNIGIDWDDINSIVTLEDNGTKIILTINSETALFGGSEVTLDVPAQIIDGSTYVPARFIAESFNCTIGYDANIISLPYREGSVYKSSIPVISIEQDIKNSNAPIDQQQADAVMKAKVRDILDKAYKDKKSSADYQLLLDEIKYNTPTESMGRFYRMEIAFYEQWNKIFLVQLYVDRYTSQFYAGDFEHGLTEDVSGFITNKYEHYLPIENKPTKVAAFSEINIAGGAPYIYTNFPEILYGNALLDTYYNKAEDIQSGRIFISHLNSTLETIDYIVRFENSGSEEISLSVTMDTAVHGDEAYPDKVIRDHMYRLYTSLSQNQPEELPIAPGAAYDIAITDIEDSQFFTGIIDFSADRNLTVTLFSAPSKERGEEGYSHIATPVTFYDFSYADNQADWDTYYTTYSGIGEGYKLQATGALTASGMVNTPWNIAFETGGSPDNINERNGVHELVEIVLAEPRGKDGEITKAQWYGNVVDETYVRDDEHRFDKDILMNYGNLGNWGVEYTMTINLVNDTNTDKIFSCGIVPTHQTTWALITENQISVGNLNNRSYSDSIKRNILAEYDEIRLGTGIKSSLVDTVLVAANTSATYTYTFVLGTESISTVYHVWSCVDAEY